MHDVIGAKKMVFILEQLVIDFCDIGSAEVWQYHFNTTEVSYLIPYCPFVPSTQRCSLHWLYNAVRRS